jgi:molybdopterin-containing oxidoreductase family membrane subunit
MAVIAPTTLGAVFAVVGAKAMWEGIFTPALMLASAFLAGTSLLAVVLPLAARFRRPGAGRTLRHGIPSLRILLAVGLVVVALLVTRSIVAGLMGEERGLRDGTVALIAGPFAPAFWGLRVAVGLVIPALLLALPFTRTPMGLFFAGGAALVGVFADRLLFVVAGQATPVTAASGTVTYGFAVYIPSPVEVLVVLGAGAFVAAGYTLAERYHDLGGDDDHHAGYGLAPVRARIARLAGEVRERLRERLRPAPPEADADA